MWSVDKNGFLRNAYEAKDAMYNNNVSYMCLPRHKKNNENIEKIKAIVLTISRDKATFADALDRIEDNTNNHARHFSINRDGRIIQYSSIYKSIKHINDFNNNNKVTVDGVIITNKNSISIEIINCGRLCPTEHPISQRNVYTSCGFYFNKTQVKIIGNDHYEAIPYKQNNTLKEIIYAISKRSPDLAVIGTKGWQSMHDFNVTPALPLKSIYLI